MKKIVMPVILILLTGLIFVSALQMDKNLPGYGTIGADYVEVSIKFNNGWNLIHGLPNPEWLSGGDITSENIKAIYGFDIINKEYVRFYPNPEENKIGGSNFAWSDYVKIGAFWVYIDKSGETEYWTLEPLPINAKQLIKGWNFVGITHDMISDADKNEFKEIQTLVGNCNIEKHALWDSENQEWWTEPWETSNSEKFYDHHLWTGWLIKVSDNCKLGESEESTAPPAIPT